MKYILGLVLLMLFGLIGYCQSKSYKSSVKTNYTTSSDVKVESRDISISDSIIVITNFIGGKIPLELTIDSTTTKKFLYTNDCIWNYCTATIYKNIVKFVAVVNEKKRNVIVVSNKG